MSEQQSLQKEEEQQKKKGGFFAFLSINQNTFINQSFNKAIWKCFNYYSEEFQKQKKKDPNEIYIQDFFETGQSHKFENQNQIERYCIVEMKKYSDSHFVEEQKQYSDCRKQCEDSTASSGKVLSFIKNEKCYKKCRIDFENSNKEKVALVFSKYVPELLNLVQVNKQLDQKREEDRKIQEIQRQYEGTNK